jgi:acyl dehydratase
MGNLNFDIGTAYTFAKTFSELDVFLFAEITGDYFPAHFSEEYAKATPYQNKIVHGCLTFSLASTVSGMAAMNSGHSAIACGYDVLRFKRPVFFGDTITATYTVTKINQEERLVTADCVMTNQNGEVVLTAIHHLKILD